MYRQFYEHALKKVTGSNGQLMALCPFHKDETPSLSIECETGKFFCHACKATGNAFTMAKKLGIPYTAVPGYDPHYTKPSASDSKPVLQKTYEYTDEHGNCLFQVCRYFPKAFKQRRPDGKGGWVYNMQGARRVLYNLPQILKAPLVLFVEGEKDADELTQLGYTATTSPMGAGKWKSEYAQFFVNKTVIILPDNDAPGLQHAEQIATEVAKVATVRIVKLPKSLGKGGDISDFLTKYGKEIFHELILSPVPETLSSALDAQHIPFHKLPLTDYGNAIALARLYGSRLRYDFAKKQWMIWQQSHWKEDKIGQIKRISLDVISERLHSASQCTGEEQKKQLQNWCKSSQANYRIESLTKLAQAMYPIAVHSESFDNDPLLLACANGTVDLRTGNLYPSNPKDLISMSTNIHYDPTANAPRWASFLNEIFNDDQDIINFIQLAVGYSLTGHITEQCFFILYGKGSNGKSTFLSLIHRLLGDYAEVVPSATFVANPLDAAKIPNDIAALFKKRFALASEMKERASLNEERLKSLTGDEPIRARFLHKEWFTFVPTFKIWLAVNHKPNILDMSEGFWRRVRLIPFERQFPKHERDLSLKEALIAELSGILNWALEGCLAWQKLGLPIPEKVMQASNDYREESDVLQQFFNDCCILSADARVSSSQLYKCYVEWAEQNKEFKVSHKKFSSIMVERGFERKQHGKNRCQHFFGIGLIDESQKE